MRTVTYSRADLFTLMRNDAGISVDEVHSWYSDDDGSITVDVLEPGDSRPHEKP